MKVFQSVLVFIFFICSYGVQAQFQIQAGLNASSLRSSNGVFSVETSSDPGFHIGVAHSSLLNPTFSFKPAALFSTKGAAFGSFVPSLKLNYLEIPLSFVYQKNPERGFYADAGPYLAILLSAKDGNIDVKDNYNTLDFGLAIGAGFDFGKIILGGRGGVGLSNVTKAASGIAQEIRTTNITGHIYAALKI